MTSSAIEAEVVNEPTEAHAANMLARLPASTTDALVLQREPDAVLAEATKAAKALMAVMAQKPDKVMMNGQQYLENEDWLTIGHFYGVTSQIESDRYVVFDDVKGWEATAVLVARDGRVLGRATAMCLNDEEKWSTRPKKEWAYCLGPEDDHSKHAHDVEDPGPGRIIWVDNPNKPGKSLPKKARIQTGEEKVPFFQLRSMAQTRASSKVHASVLRFVPVLAGYKATPAEELPDAERVSNTKAGYVVDAPTAHAAIGALAAAYEGAAAQAGVRVPPAEVPVIDQATGEERPAPPAGYFYVSGYTYNRGWHEFVLLNEHGHGLKLSTKKDIGFIAEDAQANGVPVAVTTSPKKNRYGRVVENEAYVNSITPLEYDDDDDEEAEIEQPPMLTDDDIPF